MSHTLIRQIEIIAFICITVAGFHHDVHAGDLLHEETDKKPLLNTANPSLAKASQNPEIDVFMNSSFAPLKWRRGAYSLG